MSQVDSVVYFSLLYQFIFLFVVFYFWLSSYFLPPFFYAIKSRKYLTDSLSSSFSQLFFIFIFVLFVLRNKVYSVYSKPFLIKYMFN